MKYLFSISYILILSLLIIQLNSSLTIKSQNYVFQHLELAKVERSVQLSANYPTQTLQISFKTLQNQGTQIFEHVVPENLQKKIVRITFSKTKQSKQYFTYQKIYTTNNHGDKIYVYAVNLKNIVFTEEEATIVIKCIFVDRYVNLPQSITLSEQQKLQYEDYKDYYTPYKVIEQSVTYKFQKIISFSKNGEKKGLSSVLYKSTNTQPFHSQTVILHGVNNDPQVLFSQVTKIIEISHWGNIAITEFYKAKNIGPNVKGQFSRMQFSESSSDSKNAFDGLQCSLPYQAWGLYYRDEVGNISTSKAYRNHGTRTVQVAFVPRFKLLGGWKSNWEIGYNLDTKSFLKQQGTHFETINLKAIYTMEKVLAQKYTIKIILPEGSTNVKIRLDEKQIQSSQIQLGKQFSYLDFIGKPTLILPDQHQMLPNSQISITYTLDNISIIKKPLILFGIFFSLLIVGIIMRRIQLNAFSESNKEKSKSQ